ncbi:MAG: peptidoglycan DD-metalloendopeptidase family protein [Paludibacteraceae bacterium]|nr:peptidoglycan DD-metalloendopeptidase family protein [Paludibacteraceae bacterium]
MNILRYIFIFLFSVGLTFVQKPEQGVSAQTKKTQTTKTTKKEDIKSLKKEQKQLKNQINNTDKKLSETRKSTKQSLQELERLNADIEYRDMLIHRRSTEIDQINNQIDSLTQSVSSLSKEYDNMRKKFADMIYYAYMTKSQQDKLLYVLSSKSFQEGYRRFQYLTSLAEMRKQQSIALSQTRQDIQTRRDKMNQLKEKTEELLKKQEQEKNYTIQQKQRQDKLVESLRSRESELKAELRKQQIAAENLNQRIQDEIARQAAEAARKKQLQQQKKTATNNNKTQKPATQNTTKKPQTSTATTTSNYVMSNEEKVIAGGFAKNKGLLMWPVKGTITGKFGKQSHPVLKDVIINNKGIYISSAPGAKAMAVYDGVVSQCFSVPGGNNAVIVRHGKYLTVYANLTQIYVKNGDKIKRNTPIGKIYQESDNKTTLFFQVWEEKNLLNPQLWLHK